VRHVQLDFLIIGAHKSGTTTLTDALAHHPDIFMPSVKETRFFTARWSEGPEFLTPFYRGRRDETLVGGADVHLLFFPEAPERIRQHNPHLKLVCILRNPTERAYSAYWFARKNGWETSPTFEEALEREAERACGDYTERSELTYLAHGRYHEQLSRFTNLFDRSQLLVLLTEELQGDPHGVEERVIRWLGLEPGLEEGVANGDTRRSNVAGRARIPAAQRMLMARDTALRRAARRLLSPAMRERIERRVVAPLARFNSAPLEYPAMNPATRERLDEYFQPHNDALARFLGRELAGWG